MKENYSLWIQGYDECGDYLAKGACIHFLITPVDNRNDVASRSVGLFNLWNNYSTYEEVIKETKKLAKSHEVKFPTHKVIDETQPKVLLRSM